MSPVPEPMHGGRQGPNGTEEDEDLTSPSALPPGPLLPSSSDEELDLNDSENAPPGYHPLPQDLEADDDDQEDEIDYNSLSGLMSALATHGPNRIHVSEDGEVAATGTEVVEDRGGDSIATPVKESAQEWDAAEVRERAGVWNSNTPAPDRLELDCGKVKQIKSVMASFTLPESAIPPWAQNLSEEEWKSQVSHLLAQQGSQ